MLYINKMMMMNENHKNQLDDESAMTMMINNYKPKLLRDLICVTSTDILSRNDLSNIKKQIFKSVYKSILKNENKTSLLDKEKISFSYESIIQIYDKKFRKFIKLHKQHFELLTMVAEINPNLEYHEVISVNDPFIFHIDMDSDNKDLINYVPTIMDNLERITNKKLKYIITGSTNFNKKFHLIVPNLVCENGNAYYQLMLKLTNELSNNVIEDNRWKSFQRRPDKSEKFVNLRMICSNKYNDNNKTFERKKYIIYANYDIKSIQDCILTRYGLHNDTFDKDLFDFDIYFHKEIIIEEIKDEIIEDIDINNDENFCNIPTDILIKSFEMIEDRASLSRDEWLKTIYCIYNYIGNKNLAEKIIHKFSSTWDSYNQNQVNSQMPHKRQKAYIFSLPKWLNDSGNEDMANIIKNYIYKNKHKKSTEVALLCKTKPTILINILEKIDIRKAYKKDGLIDFKLFVSSIKSLYIIEGKDFDSELYYSVEVFLKFSKCKYIETKRKDAISFINNDNTDLFDILEDEKPVDDINYILNVLEEIYKLNYRELLDKLYPVVTSSQDINNYLQKINFQHYEDKYDDKCKYIQYEDNKLIPYFTNDNKFEIVKSPPGSGKTHFAIDYIKQNNVPKFLYVSIGKALGNDFYNSCIRGNIKVDHYENKKFDAKNQVHIWEYESLWKIKYTEYDVVILDEFASLLNNTVISSTNGNNIRTNFHILKTFVNKAQNVLCLSADTNPSIVNNFLKEFNTKNESVFIQENNKQVTSNTNYSVYFDKDFFMKDIKNDYDNGLNIAVCSTRKDYTDYLKAYIFQNKITDCSDYINNLLLDNDYTIKTFKSLLKPHLQPVKYKAYNNDKIIDDIQVYLDTLSYTYFHGDLTTSHKQKILENKETEIYKNLLIYTPAIQSGVDFSICHYDKIYLFADSCSISIENQIQLFRRVRHLTLENVNIYIPPFNSQCMTKKPTTFQNKKYELKIQVNELSSIEDIIHKTLIESSDNISFLNDNQTIMKELNEQCFLTKQFIQKNVEQTNMKRFFYLLFLQYLYKFVNDDSKISFKTPSNLLSQQDIQDTDVLKEHIKKVKEAKYKLTLDVRQDVIDALKQKADIDSILKTLENIEDKGIDDKQLITSLYASKHIRQDKTDDLDTETLKFVEDNNTIIHNYRNILQNNLLDTYKKDLDKINMSKEEKLEMFKRKDNKVFNHYLLLELLKIIGIDFDVSKIPNDDVLILSDNKNTWINERTYTFINLIKDWNVNELPYEQLSNFFNKYIATFNCGKSVHTNQHITKRLSSILKTYLGITLDIDRSRKQVNNERKCVFNYTMIFADGLLDIFDKIKVAP